MVREAAKDEALVRGVLTGLCTVFVGDESVVHGRFTRGDDASSRRRAR